MSAGLYAPPDRDMMRLSADIQYRKTLALTVGEILTSYLLPEVDFVSAFSVSHCPTKSSEILL
jgi:hypothetical protein